MYITYYIRLTYKIVLYLVYELPEDGTDVPKHVGVVTVRTVKRVCKLCINLVL